MKNELDRLKNEKIIAQKSLESIIRALMDTIRKVYGRMRRLLKKRRGKDIEDNSEIFDGSQGMQVNAVKIDQIFERTVALFEEED